MSRGVLEVCLERVPNKFELVLLASVRARKIAAGSNAMSGLNMTLGRGPFRRGDLRYQKAPALALREIASGVNYLDDIRNECRQGGVGRPPVYDKREGSGSTSEESGA